MSHEAQLPLCREQFDANQRVHDTLWKKHDALDRDLMQTRIDMAKEVTELKTKMILASAIGSIVGSALVSAVIGLLFSMLKK